MGSAEHGDLARSFPTGVTILRVLAIVRWLAWGWMVAVVAFSGDALRQPSVAWLAVAAGLGLAIVSPWRLRAAPTALLGTGFVLTEGAFALALNVLDGWVFEPDPGDRRLDPPGGVRAVADHATQVHSHRHDPPDDDEAPGCRGDGGGAWRR